MVVGRRDYTPAPARVNVGQAVTATGATIATDRYFAGALADLALRAPSSTQWARSLRTR